MRYTVEGGNAKQRKIVDAAMSYVIQLLNIPDDIFVEITLGVFSSHGVMQTSPRRFEIEVHKRVSNEEIVYTIFHEMKHVEQMVHKRLQHGWLTIIWEGVDHSNTPYFECPWEKEAYNFEKNGDFLLTRLAA